MTGPNTAREALIVEALGDVAHLLDRVESLSSSMEAGRLALANANAELGDRLKAFEAGVASLTQQAKARVVEHIVRRTGEATSEAIETQARAMNAAARLAFSAQVDSNLARLTATLQQVIHRVDRPWDLWLTHAATAAVSAAITWWVLGSFAFR
jgi:hypothetical protein